MIYTDPVEANPIDEVASIAELVRDMHSGAVETLLILGGNPVYDAPADLNFLEALKKIEFRARIWDSTRTKPRRGATGMYRRRTIWNRGATRGRMTEPRRSCSR